MEQKYTVKSGDNLTKIAKQFGVDIGAVTGYRSGNPNLIYPGEVLTIGTPTPATPPVTPTPPATPPVTPPTPTTPTPPTGQTYTIKSGDTLSALAVRYGTTVQALMSANPQITDPNKIFAGASLNLPGGTTPITPSIIPETPPQPFVDSTAQKNAEAQAKAKKDAEDLIKSQADQAEIDRLKREKEKQNLYTELGLSPTGEKITAPTKPDLVSTFETLRSEKGLETLESQINTLDAQIRDTQTSLGLAYRTEEGKIGPMSLIGEKEKALQLQADRQLADLNSRKSVLVEEYNTKLNVISQTMQFAQQDYANATADYQTKFNNSLKIYDLLKTEENETINVAKANLTVLTNYLQTGIQNGVIDPTNIPADTQNLITKLELQQGLTPGITAQLLSVMKPEKEVRATIISDDKSTANIIYSDNTIDKFNLTTGGTIPTGNTIKSGSMVINESDIATGQQYLDSKKGDDGYTNTAEYIKMLDAWKKDGGLEQDFFTNYPPKNYLNPNDATVPSYIRAKLDKPTKEDNTAELNKAMEELNKKWWQFWK